MNRLYILILSFVLFISTGIAYSQVIWTGPQITFTKSDNVDWTLAQNQDFITENVIITRQNTQGIFNIAQETSYSFGAPTDTEWAFGTTANLVGLSFDNWVNTIGADPPASIGQNMVLHLISENIFIDIRFLSWTQGGAGGGFSYLRSTQPTSIDDLNEKNSVRIYPNPAIDYIGIANLKQRERVELYDILGSRVKSIELSPNEKVSIQDLDQGIYYLKFEDGSKRKFVKK